MHVIFTDRKGDRLPFMNVHHAFGQASTAAGLRTEAQPQRMHDLWYRDGADVAARIPVLSTYQGHTDPLNTCWYLNAVPELVAHAATRVTDAGGQEGS